MASDRGGAALFAIVFLLADSAFHGDRVAVPRRLSKAGLSDAAGHRTRRPARRASRPCVRGSLLLPVSLAPALSASAAASTLAVGARARRGRCSSWLCGSHAARSERHRPRAVLRIDHLSAAALDRDDRRQAVTVHDLPAVNASLNAHLRRTAAHRLRTDPPRRIEAPSSVHARSVRHFVALPDLLCHLSRAGRLGPVPAPRFRAAAVLHDPHHARHAGRIGSATGDHHAVAGPQGTLSAAPPASRAGHFRSGCMSRSPACWSTCCSTSRRGLSESARARFASS